jgi:hypothetical protein
MRNLMRFRPSPAMVVASIALFVSVGGITVTALGSGSYVIHFGEDVSGRALTATGVNARVIADATL